MNFTGAELAGGAELTAPVEKATVGPVEKAAAGSCTGEARADGTRNEDGGRRAVVLCHGDADRRSRGAMEREAQWRAPSHRVVAALR
jgi:hypothetical protein